MHWLLEITGEAFQKKVTLEEGAQVVGRDKSCDIVLPHLSVSRRHARLEIRQGTFFIWDLNSRNGTWLNGQRVQEAEFTEKDRLKIGPFSLQLRREKEESAAAAQPFIPFFREEPDGEKIEVVTVPFYLGWDERRKKVVGTPDPYASGNLLKIRLEQGQFTIHNMFDRDGILLNGKNFHKEPLRDGDEVTVYHRSFRFHLFSESEGEESRSAESRGILFRKIVNLLTSRHRS